MPRYYNPETGKMEELPTGGGKFTSEEVLRRQAFREGASRSRTNLIQQYSGPTYNAIVENTDDFDGLQSLSPNRDPEQDAIDAGYIAAENQSTIGNIIAGVGTRVVSIIPKVGETLGSLGGLAVAAATGNVEHMYDNPFNQAMRAFDGWLRESANIRETRDYKEGGMMGKVTSAKFWAEDAADVVAYVAAAYATGVGVGKVASGITKIAGNAAKLKNAQTLMNAGKGIDVAMKEAQVGKMWQTLEKTNKALSGVANKQGLGFVPGSVSEAFTTAINTHSEAVLEANEFRLARFDEEAQARGYANWAAMEEAANVPTRTEDGIVLPRNPNLSADMENIKQKVAPLAAQIYTANLIGLFVPNAIQTKSFFGHGAGSVYEVAQAVKKGTFKAPSLWKTASNVVAGTVPELAEEGFQLNHTRYAESLYNTGAGAVNPLKAISGAFGYLSSNFSDVEDQQGYLLSALIGAGQGLIGGIRENAAVKEGKKLAGTWLRDHNDSLSALDGDFIEDAKSLYRTTKNEKGETVPEINGQKVTDLSISRALDEKLANDMYAAKFIGDEENARILREDIIARRLFQYFGDSYYDNLEEAEKAANADFFGNEKLMENAGVDKELVAETKAKIAQYKNLFQSINDAKAAAFKNEGITLDQVKLAQKLAYAKEVKYNKLKEAVKGVDAKKVEDGDITDKQRNAFMQIKSYEDKYGVTVTDRYNKMMEDAGKNIVEYEKRAGDLKEIEKSLYTDSLYSKAVKTMNTMDTVNKDIALLTQQITDASATPEETKERTAKLEQLTENKKNLQIEQQQMNAQIAGKGELTSKIAAFNQQIEEMKFIYGRTNDNKIASVYSTPFIQRESKFNKNEQSLYIRDYIDGVRANTGGQKLRDKLAQIRSGEIEFGEQAYLATMAMHSKDIVFAAELENFKNNLENARRQGAIVRQVNNPIQKLADEQNTEAVRAAFPLTGKAGENFVDTNNPESVTGALAALAALNTASVTAPVIAKVLTNVDNAVKSGRLSSDILKSSAYQLLQQTYDAILKTGEESVNALNASLHSTDVTKYELGSAEGIRETLNGGKPTNTQFLQTVQKDGGLSVMESLGSEVTQEELLADIDKFARLAANNVSSSIKRATPLRQEIRDPAVPMFELSQEYAIPGNNQTFFTKEEMTAAMKDPAKYAGLDEMEVFSPMSKRQPTTITGDMTQYESGDFLQQKFWQHILDGFTNDILAITNNTSYSDIDSVEDLVITLGRTIKAFEHRLKSEDLAKNKLMTRDNTLPPLQKLMAEAAALLPVVQANAERSAQKSVRNAYRYMENILRIVNSNFEVLGVSDPQLKDDLAKVFTEGAEAQSYYAMKELFYKITSSQAGLPAQALRTEIDKLAVSAQVEFAATTNVDALFGSVRTPTVMVADFLLASKLFDVNAEGWDATNNPIDNFIEDHNLAELFIGLQQYANGSPSVGNIVWKQGVVEADAITTLISMVTKAENLQALQFLEMVRSSEMKTADFLTLLHNKIESQTNPLLPNEEQELALLQAALTLNKSEEDIKSVEESNKARNIKIKELIDAKVAASADSKEPFDKKTAAARYEALAFPEDDPFIGSVILEGTGGTGKTRVFAPLLLAIHSDFQNEKASKPIDLDTATPVTAQGGKITTTATPVTQVATPNVPDSPEVIQELEAAQEAVNIALETLEDDKVSAETALAAVEIAVAAQQIATPATHNPEPIQVIANSVNSMFMTASMDERIMRRLAVRYTHKISSPASLTDGQIVRIDGQLFRVEKTNNSHDLQDKNLLDIVGTDGKVRTIEVDKFSIYTNISGLDVGPSSVLNMVAPALVHAVTRQHTRRTGNTKFPKLTRAQAERLIRKLSAQYGIEAVIDASAAEGTSRFEEHSSKRRIVFAAADINDADTIFHEFAHPFVNALAARNEQLFTELAAAANVILSSEEIDRIQHMYTPEQWEYEKAVAVLERKASEDADWQQAIRGSILAKILDFFKQLFGMYGTLNPKDATVAAVYNSIRTSGKFENLSNREIAAAALRGKLAKIEAMFAYADAAGDRLTTEMLKPLLSLDDAATKDYLEYLESRVGKSARTDKYSKQGTHVEELLSLSVTMQEALVFNKKRAEDFDAELHTAALGNTWAETQNLNNEIFGKVNIVDGQEFVTSDLLTATVEKGMLVVSKGEPAVRYQLVGADAEILILDELYAISSEDTGKLIKILSDLQKSRKENGQPRLKIIGLGDPEQISASGTSGRTAFVASGRLNSISNVRFTNPLRQSMRVGNYEVIKLALEFKGNRHRVQTRDTKATVYAGEAGGKGVLATPGKDSYRSTLDANIITHPNKSKILVVFDKTRVPELEKLYGKNVLVRHVTAIRGEQADQVYIDTERHRNETSLYSPANFNAAMYTALTRGKELAVLQMEGYTTTTTASADRQKVNRSSEERSSKSAYLNQLKNLLKATGAVSASPVVANANQNAEIHLAPTPAVAAKPAPDKVKDVEVQEEKEEEQEEILTSAERNAERIAKLQEEFDALEGYKSNPETIPAELYVDTSTVILAQNIATESEQSTKKDQIKKQLSALDLLEKDSSTARRIQEALGIKFYPSDTLATLPVSEAKKLSEVFNTALLRFHRTLTLSQKRLAAIVNERLQGTDTTFGKATKPLNKSHPYATVLGLYSHTLNQVVSFQGNIDSKEKFITILHESIHALAVGATAWDDNFTKELFPLFKEVIEVAKQQNKFTKFETELSSIDEFIAYALNGGEFTEFIKSIKTQKNKEVTEAKAAVSIWVKLMQILKDWLYGESTNYYGDSAYADLEEIFTNSWTQQIVYFDKSGVELDVTISALERYEVEYPEKYKQFDIKEFEKFALTLGKDYRHTYITTLARTIGTNPKFNFVQTAKLDVITARQEAIQAELDVLSFDEPAPIVPKTETQKEDAILDTTTVPVYNNKPVTSFGLTSVDNIIAGDIVITPGNVALKVIEVLDNMLLLEDNSMVIPEEEIGYKLLRFSVSKQEPTSIGVSGPQPQNKQFAKQKDNTVNIPRHVTVADEEMRTLAKQLANEPEVQQQIEDKLAEASKVTIKTVPSRPISTRNAELADKLKAKMQTLFPEVTFNMSMHQARTEFTAKSELAVQNLTSLKNQIAAISKQESFTAAKLAAINNRYEELELGTNSEGNGTLMLNGEVLTTYDKNEIVEATSEEVIDVLLERLLDRLTDTGKLLKIKQVLETAVHEHTNKTIFADVDSGTKTEIVQLLSDVLDSKAINELLTNPITYPAVVQYLQSTHEDGDTAVSELESKLIAKIAALYPINIIDNSTLVVETPYGVNYISLVQTFDMAAKMAGYKGKISKKVQKKLEAEKVQPLHDAVAFIQSSGIDYQYQSINNVVMGMAQLEALQVFINPETYLTDTIPHEYAHIYLNWYKDHPIVQKGIEVYGNMENLVQAIGEQVVAQEGEALNIWKSFVTWLLDLFNKDTVRQVLTDAFLQRLDLNTYFKTEYGSDNFNMTAAAYKYYLEEKAKDPELTIANYLERVRFFTADAAIQDEVTPEEKLHNKNLQLLNIDTAIDEHTNKTKVTDTEDIDTVDDNYVSTPNISTETSLPEPKRVFGRANLTPGFQPRVISLGTHEVIITHPTSGSIRREDYLDPTTQNVLPPSEDTEGYDVMVMAVNNLATKEVELRAVGINPYNQTTLHDLGIIENTAGMFDLSNPVDVNVVKYTNTVTLAYVTPEDIRSLATTYHQDGVTKRAVGKLGKNTKYQEFVYAKMVDGAPTPGTDEMNYRDVYEDGLLAGGSLNKVLMKVIRRYGVDNIESVTIDLPQFKSDLTNKLGKPYYVIGIRGMKNPIRIAAIGRKLHKSDTHLLESVKEQVKLWTKLESTFGYLGGYDNHKLHALILAYKAALEVVPDGNFFKVGTKRIDRFDRTAIHAHHATLYNLIPEDDKRLFDQLAIAMVSSFYGPVVSGITFANASKDSAYTSLAMVLKGEDMPFTEKEFEQQLLAVKAALQDAAFEALQPYVNDRMTNEQAVQAAEKAVQFYLKSPTQFDAEKSGILAEKLGIPNASKQIIWALRDKGKQDKEVMGGIFAKAFKEATEKGEGLLSVDHDGILGYKSGDEIIPLKQVTLEAGRGKAQRAVNSIGSANVREDSGLVSLQLSKTAKADNKENKRYIRTHKQLLTSANKEEVEVAQFRNVSRAIIDALLGVGAHKRVERLPVNRVDIAQLEDKTWFLSFIANKAVQYWESQNPTETMSVETDPDAIKILEDLYVQLDSTKEEGTIISILTEAGRLVKQLSADDRIPYLAEFVRAAGAQLTAINTEYIAKKRLKLDALKALTSFDSKGDVIGGARYPIVHRTITKQDGTINTGFIGTKDSQGVNIELWDNNTKSLKNDPLVEFANQNIVTGFEGFNDTVITVDFANTVETAPPMQSQEDNLPKEVEAIKDFEEFDLDEIDLDSMFLVSNEILSKTISLRKAKKIAEHILGKKAATDEVRFVTQTALAALSGEPLARGLFAKGIAYAELRDNSIVAESLYHELFHKVLTSFDNKDRLEAFTLLSKESRLYATYLKQEKYDLLEEVLAYKFQKFAVAPKSRLKKFLQRILSIFKIIKQNENELEQLFTQILDGEYSHREYKVNLTDKLLMNLSQFNGSVEIAERARDMLEKAVADTTVNGLTVPHENIVELTQTTNGKLSKINIPVSELRVGLITQEALSHVASNFFFGANSSVLKDLGKRRAVNRRSLQRIVKDIKEAMPELIVPTDLSDIAEVSSLFNSILDNAVLRKNGLVANLEQALTELQLVALDTHALSSLKQEGVIASLLEVIYAKPLTHEKADIVRKAENTEQTSIEETFEAYLDELSIAEHLADTNIKEDIMEMHIKESMKRDWKKELSPSIKERIIGITYWNPYLKRNVRMAWQEAYARMLFLFQNQRFDDTAFVSSILENRAMILGGTEAHKAANMAVIAHLARLERDMDKDVVAVKISKLDSIFPQWQKYSSNLYNWYGAALVSYMESGKKKITFTAAQVENMPTVVREVLSTPEKIMTPAVVNAFNAAINSATKSADIDTATFAEILAETLFDNITTTYKVPQNEVRFIDDNLVLVRIAASNDTTVATIPEEFLRFSRSYTTVFNAAKEAYAKNSNPAYSYRIGRISGTYETNAHIPEAIAKWLSKRSNVEGHTLSYRTQGKKVRSSAKWWLDILEETGVNPYGLELAWTQYKAQDAVTTITSHFGSLTENEFVAAEMNQVSGNMHMKSLATLDSTSARIDKFMGSIMQKFTPTVQGETSVTMLMQWTLGKTRKHYNPTRYPHISSTPNNAAEVRALAQHISTTKVINEDMALIQAVLHALGQPITVTAISPAAAKTVATNLKDLLLPGVNTEVNQDAMPVIYEAVMATQRFRAEMEEVEKGKRDETTVQKPQLLDELLTSYYAKIRGITEVLYSSSDLVRSTSVRGGDKESIFKFTLASKANQMFNYLVAQASGQEGVLMNMAQPQFMGSKNMMKFNHLMRSPKDYPILSQPNWNYYVRKWGTGIEKVIPFKAESAEDTYYRGFIGSFLTYLKKSGRATYLQFGYTKSNKNDVVGAELLVMKDEQVYDALADMWLAIKARPDFGEYLENYNKDSLVNATIFDENNLALEKLGFTSKKPIVAYMKKHAPKIFLKQANLFIDEMLNARLQFPNVKFHEKAGILDIMGAAFTSEHKKNWQQMFDISKFDSGKYDAVKIREALLPLVLTFMKNNYVNSYALTQAYMGDFANYGNAAGVIKRSTVSINSAQIPYGGKFGITPTFNLFIVDDIISNIKKADKLEEDTDFVYEEVLDTFGLSEHDKKQILSQAPSTNEDINGSSYILPETIEELERGYGKSYNFMSALKPVISTQVERTDRNGVSDIVPINGKLASFVITPELERDNPMLANIAKFMRQHKIHIIAPPSAIKTYTPKVRVSLKDIAAGKEIDMKMYEWSFVPFSSADYRMQLNAKHDMLEKVKVFSQLMYFANPLDENNEERKQLYSNASKLITLAMKEFMEKTQGDSKYEFIHGLLVSAMKAGNNSELLDIVSSFNADEQVYNYPGIDTMAFNKFISYLNKNVIQIKFRGNGMVMHPDFGIHIAGTSRVVTAKLEKFKTTVEAARAKLADGTKKAVDFGLTPEQASEIEHTRRSLSMYISDSGTLTTEVLLPRGYLTPEMEKMIEENNKSGKHADFFNSADILGWRIPSAELQNAAAIKIVGFYEDHYNSNIIITPRELTLFHGSDFDIDSLYLASRSFLEADYVLDQAQIIKKQAYDAAVAKIKDKATDDKQLENSEIKKLQIALGLLSQFPELKTIESARDKHATLLMEQDKLQDQIEEHKEETRKSLDDLNSTSDNVHNSAETTDRIKIAKHKLKSTQTNLQADTTKLSVVTTTLNAAVIAGRQLISAAASKNTKLYAKKMAQLSAKVDKQLVVDYVSEIKSKYATAAEDMPTPLDRIVISNLTRTVITSGEGEVVTKKKVSINMVKGEYFDYALKSVNTPTGKKEKLVYNPHVALLLEQYINEPGANKEMATKLLKMTYQHGMLEGMFGVLAKNKRRMLEVTSEKGLKEDIMAAAELVFPEAGSGKKALHLLQGDFDLSWPHHNMRATMLAHVGSKSVGIVANYSKAWSYLSHASKIGGMALPKGEFEGVKLGGITYNTLPTHELDPITGLPDMDKVLLIGNASLLQTYVDNIKSNLGGPANLTPATLKTILGLRTLGVSNALAIKIMMQPIMRITAFQDQKTSWETAKSMLDATTQYKYKTSSSAGIGIQKESQFNIAKMFFPANTKYKNNDISNMSVLDVYEQFIRQAKVTQPTPKTAPGFAGTTSSSNDIMKRALVKAELQKGLLPLLKKFAANNPDFVTAAKALTEDGTKPFKYDNFEIYDSALAITALLNSSEKTDEFDTSISLEDIDKGLKDTGGKSVTTLLQKDSNYANLQQKIYNIAMQASAIGNAISEVARMAQVIQDKIPVDYAEFSTFFETIHTVFDLKPILAKQQLDYIKTGRISKVTTAEEVSELKVNPNFMLDASKLLESVPHLHSSILALLNMDEFIQQNMLRYHPKITKLVSDVALQVSSIDAYGEHEVKENIRNEVLRYVASATSYLEEAPYNYIADETDFIDPESGRTFAGNEAFIRNTGNMMRQLLMYFQSNPDLGIDTDLSFLMSALTVQADGSIELHMKLHADMGDMQRFLNAVENLKRFSFTRDAEYGTYTFAYNSSASVDAQYSNVQLSLFKYVNVKEGHRTTERSIGNILPKQVRKDFYADFKGLLDKLISTKNADDHIMYSVLRAIGHSAENIAYVQHVPGTVAFTKERVEDAVAAKPVFYNAIMNNKKSRANKALAKFTTKFVIGGKQHKQLYKVVGVEEQADGTLDYLLQSLGYIPRNTQYNASSGMFDEKWTMDEIFPKSTAFVFVNDFENTVSKRSSIKYGRHSYVKENPSTDAEKSMIVEYAVDEALAVKLNQAVSKAIDEVYTGVYGSRVNRNKPALSRLIPFAISTRILKVLTDEKIIKNGKLTWDLKQIQYIHSSLAARNFNNLKRVLRNLTISDSTNYNDIAEALTNVPTGETVLLYNNAADELHNPRIAKLVEIPTTDGTAASRTLQFYGNLQQYAIQYADVLDGAITVEQKMAKLLDKLEKPNCE